MASRNAGVQRISIIGAVKKPGALDVSGRKTVLDILATAGGLEEDAEPMLFLIRPSRPQKDSRIR